MEQQQISGLSNTVQQQLNVFVEASTQAFGPNLKSVVLYGSAAEGKLRATSDVNLILVLETFEISQVNKIRETLRTAHAAINLNTMFLLQSEIATAMQAFAVKFQDIVARHQILFGADVFKGLTVSRSATIERLRQSLANLTLRLRERYALVSLREEQLALVVAELAGPVRAAAHTYLELLDTKSESPKHALELLAKGLPGDYTGVLQNISTARETRSLAIGEAAKTVFGLLELLQAMTERSGSLK